MQNIYMASVSPNNLGTSKQTDYKRLDIERMVLGNMIKHPDIMEHALHNLTREHFSLADHMILFDTICLIAKKHLKADAYLIQAFLPNNTASELMSSVGIASLILEASSVHNALELISLLREAHGKDKIKGILRESLDRLQVNKENLTDLIDSIQSQLLHIAMHNTPSEGVSIKSVIQGASPEHSFLNILQKKQDLFSEHQENGMFVASDSVSTGFIDLDRKLGGLTNSNLIIVAARPSMGKTSFAINIAEHVAIKKHKTVCILSLEMSTIQLVERLIAAKARIDIQKLKTGNIDANDYQKIVKAVKELEQTNIIFNDSSNLTINSISLITRRLKTLYDINVLIVDYIQLITTKTNNNDSRQQVISEISRGLKIIARELNIPVIALSQLSRKVEERPGHRPQMSDLRESGSIEQDADQILLLLRPEYYDPNDRPGLAEIIIAKNRHGNVGSVFLQYIHETASFANDIPGGLNKASFDGIPCN